MSSTSLSSSSSSTNVAPPPDGASCWLCLEEGPDDSGAPLVRNCSCRGSSGFAHLSCIIEYAENIARQNIQHDEETNSSAFFKCPNCKQDYQGDLRDDMMSPFVAFYDSLFPDGNLNKALQMSDAMCRLLELDASIETDRLEGEELVTELLASIDEKVQDWDLLYGMIEAKSYVCSARFYEGISSDEGLKTAKSLLQKARDKYMIMGGNHDLDRREMEIEIGRIESRLRGSIGRQDKAAEIKLFRDKYDCYVKDGNDVCIIDAGIDLANVLHIAYRTIEAERLLGKMVTTSHLLHGPEHRCTVLALSLLKVVKQRWVSLECEEGWYEALRFENDGGKCVLQGPIKEQRVVDEEQTFEAESAQVRPCHTRGTPVELYGLKKADHLNGMIGDARDYCDSTDRFVVYLEDNGWKPVKVKPENLRVVFELPDLKNLD